MFKESYKVTVNPFGPGPDLAFLYVGSGHEELLSRLSRSVPMKQLRSSGQRRGAGSDTCAGSSKGRCDAHGRRLRRVRWISQE